MTKLTATTVTGGNQRVPKGLLPEVGGIGASKRVRLGVFPLMDKLHTLAYVHASKDWHRRGERKPARHIDARRGVKGKKTFKPRCFHGYRTHTAMNPQPEMVTSLVERAVSAHDAMRFPTPP